MIDKSKRFRVFISKPIKISSLGESVNVRVKETRRGICLIVENSLEFPCRVMKRFPTGLTIISPDHFSQIYLQYYNNKNNHMLHGSGRVLSSVYPFRDGSVIIKFNMMQEHIIKRGEDSDTFYMHIDKSGKETFIDKDELFKKLKNEMYKIKPMRLSGEDVVLRVSKLSLVRDFESHPINFGTNKNVINKTIVETELGISLKNDKGILESCKVINRYPNGLTIAQSKSGAIFYYTNNPEELTNGFGKKIVFIDKVAENQYMVLNIDEDNPSKMSQAYINENGEVINVSMRESEEIYQRERSKLSFEKQYDKYVGRTIHCDSESLDSEPCS